MRMQPARSFDRVAEEYERARPGYPPALLDVLPLGTAATVLDLGAGTGKLTRVLTARYRRVYAVEPLENMRAILEQVVPHAIALAGKAEAIPLPDSSVEGVFAAQAFHWFANEAAIAEIARVLRPGGVFAVVWNAPTGESPLPERFNELADALHRGSRFSSRRLEQRLELVERGGFGPPREAHLDHEQVQSHEQVIEHALSVSHLARLPDEERARVVASLRRALPEGDYRFEIRASVRWSLRR